MSDEPCGNDDCDKCYPLPRYEVSTERVSRLKHVRRIKAATPEEAQRIYDEGTAWPSSYDDRELEVISQAETAIVVMEPRSERTIDALCWHRLPKDEPSSDVPSSDFMGDEGLASDEVISLRAELAAVKADKHHQITMSAGRLATFAWVLMLVMVAFASVLIISGAIRSNKTCPVLQGTGSSGDPFRMSNEGPTQVGTRVRRVSDGRVGVIVEPQQEPKGAESVKAAQPSAWAAVYGKPGEVIVVLEPAGQLGGERISIHPNALVSLDAEAP